MYNCIDICPTSAIVEPYKLDATKCISYLTIEHKGIIDKNMRKLIGNRIYGCDDCLAVCPWNKFSSEHNEPLFEPLDQVINYSKKDWIEITDEVFDVIFENSPINRPKFEGFKRNIEFVK